MPKASTEIPDIVAKADMGVAFGRGVQSYGAKTLTIGALGLGDDFLTRRLRNKKKPYRSVRKKALDVSYNVGASAAKNAGQSKLVGIDHLRAALKDLGKGPGPFGGDCPF